MIYILRKKRNQNLEYLNNTLAEYLNNMPNIAFVPDHWYTKRIQTIRSKEDYIVYKKKYYDLLKKANKAFELNVRSNR